MKFFKPFFPVLICISLIWSLAIFIAGSFVFLSAQAFYAINIESGAAIAYLWVIAGVMMISIIVYHAIRVWFCNFFQKKRTVAESEIAIFGSATKVLLSVLVCEGLKFYLDKKNKK
jgi:hypothetical protein